MYVKRPVAQGFTSDSDAVTFVTINDANGQKTETLMAKFKIDDKEFDTDQLDAKQKRVVALYQKAVEEESKAVMELELKRASRIEVGSKLRELVIDPPTKQ